MERPDLLVKAKHLTTLRREEGYAWISPDELLILRPTVTVNGPFQPDQQRLIPSTAHRLQISTGKETPLEEFNRLHSDDFKAMVGVSYSHNEPHWMSQFAPMATLSPDGHFLLFTVSTGWRVASLDGTQTINILATEGLGDITRETGCEVLPLWLPDSRSWLAISGWGMLKRRRIFQWRMDQPKPVQAAFVLGWRDGFVCGITTNNRLLMQCRNPMNDIAIDYLNTGRLPGRTTFLEVQWGRKVQAVRRYQLAIPTPGIIGHNYHRQVVLSRCGRRLAWSIRETVDPEIYPSTEDIYSLWISDLSGTDVHEIGWIKSSRKPREKDAVIPPADSESVIRANKRLPWPDELQWSPDGRQISFTFGDGLFAVSVADGLAS